jgi:ketosteroid isomerase-like protein
MKPISEKAQKGLDDYRRVESAAYNANDLDMVDNFHEDIVLTSNGAPTLHGRDSVRDFFKEVWAQNDTRFVEVVDERVSEVGNLLLISGRFTLEITPKDGCESSLDNGRFQGILIEGDDGRYRLLREACMDQEP